MKCDRQNCMYHTGLFWTSWSGPRILGKPLLVNQPFQILQLRWIALWIANAFLTPYIDQCLFSRCSVRMMTAFKGTLLVYYRFKFKISTFFWHSFVHNMNASELMLRSSVCQDGGLHPPMTSATRKVTWKLVNLLAQFHLGSFLSGLPHERSFTIKCIIEGKHIEVLLWQAMIL